MEGRRALNTGGATHADNWSTVRAMEIVYTRHGFEELAKRIAGRRALVISGPSRRFVGDALAVLRDAVVFDRARVHVPVEVVDEVRAIEGIDAIVAIGGGSTIGLGKAMRLERDIRFVVMPTTYAGSEQTSIYGITHGRDKRTGRDPHVRPDVVIYDANLTVDMPIALTVQSLFNSIAHVASAASTGTIADVSPAREALRAVEELLANPRDLDARERAARASAACAAAIEHGKPGLQHALAHTLGGALGLDHAALHALLLPHFLAQARLDLVADADLRALLARAGAPTTLAALGANAADVEAALAGRPELLPIARAAQ